MNGDRLDQWTDKDGQKRSKLKVVMSDLQFLQPKTDGGDAGSYQRSGAKSPSAPAQMGGYDEPEPEFAPPAPDGDKEIPF